MSLRVEVITTIEGLRALEPEWRELEARAGLELPFQGAIWARHWWTSFAEKRFGLRDSLQIRAVRDGTGGRLLAVAPMMLTDRPAIGPLRIRILQFFGADPNITELRGMLCEPAREAEVWAALTADLRALSHAWDWIQWGSVLAGSEGEQAIARGAGIEWGPQVPNYVLRLAPTWDEFKAGLSRNIKESLRKCYNAPKRDGHTFEFTVARTPAEVAEALPDFLRLHALRSAQGNTVRHADVFASKPARAFLCAVGPELAASGGIGVFCLRSAGKTIAARLGFFSASHLYLYYSGFEPEWGRYSVMTTTLAETIKWAIGQKIPAINLSFGKDVSKLRWKPEERTWLQAVEVSPTLRSRAVRVASVLFQQALGGRWLNRSGPLPQSPESPAKPAEGDAGEAGA